MRRLIALALLTAACSASERPEIVFDSTEIQVGVRTLTVAIADETREKRQGLKYVEELPDGLDGMLFVFPDETTATFSMRDTLIPLDIWWFDGEGVLIGSTRMEPCTAARCTSYRSPGRIGWALETPADQERLVVGEVLSTTESG